MSVNININGSQLVIGSQPEVTAICLRLTTEQIKKLCSIGTIARNKSDGFLSYAGVPYNFVIHGRSQLLLVCSYLHFYLYSKNTSYYLYSKNTSYYLYSNNTSYYLYSKNTSYYLYSNNTSYYLYSYITLLRNTPIIHHITYTPKIHHITYTPIIHHITYTHILHHITYTHILHHITYTHILHHITYTPKIDTALLLYRELGTTKNDITNKTILCRRSLQFCHTWAFPACCWLHVASIFSHSILNFHYTPYP